MREIVDLRITILSEGKDLIPKTIEIYYRITDGDLSADKCLSLPIEEFDLSKSMADIWNECIGRL